METVKNHEGSRPFLSVRREDLLAVIWIVLVAAIAFSGGLLNFLDTLSLYALYVVVPVGVVAGLWAIFLLICALLS